MNGSVVGCRLTFVVLSVLIAASIRVPHAKWSINIIRKLHHNKHKGLFMSLKKRIVS